MAEAAQIDADVVRPLIAEAVLHDDASAKESDTRDRALHHPGRIGLRVDGGAAVPEGRMANEHR